MLVLARLLNSELDVLRLYCDYLHRHVFVDVRQFYQSKRCLLPLDRALNMDDWQPTSSTDRKQAIFENALFSLASILCAVDHLNHADAIELNDEQRKMPNHLIWCNSKMGTTWSIPDTTYLWMSSFSNWAFKLATWKVFERKCSRIVIIHCNEKMFQDCNYSLQLVYREEHQVHPLYMGISRQHHTTRCMIEDVRMDTKTLTTQVWTLNRKHM